MAKAKLILDTREASRSKTTGLFPVAVKVFHQKPRIVRLGYYTSIEGWDESEKRLKKSAKANKAQNCERINQAIHQKWQVAKNLIDDLGNLVQNLTVDELIEKIKEQWDEASKKKAEEHHDLENIGENLTLKKWGAVMIKRKIKGNGSGTATWYEDGIRAFLESKGKEDMKLCDITVSFLKEFEAEHIARGNSKNTISSYVRAVRSMYNSAIKEDQLFVTKNPFDHYKPPSTTRTKKKAVAKEKFATIRSLEYKEGSALWHTKNYLLVMFICRGMNFIDLAKLKVEQLIDGRVVYGRSKTGDPLSAKITPELQEILSYYLKEKGPKDFIFPASYDGKPENYEKYKSQRRRVNERLKIIAMDAGIQEKFTTYSIRHSWATIAKYMGVDIQLISEGLGHHSTRTTEIYLKSFGNEVLDQINDIVVTDELKDAIVEN